MTRIWMIRVILCLSLLATGWGCSGPGNSKETDYESQRETPFYIEPETVAFGIVQPAVQYKLSFSTAGNISELYVELGEQVRQGAVLAKLVDSRLYEDIHAAEAELNLTQANLNKILAGVHPALITQAASHVVAAEARRPLSLLQATSQAAEVAAAQADLDYMLAQPLPEDVSIANAQVEQAKVKLENARERLDLASLVAPVDGTIREILIRAHEFAGVGQPVLILANMDVLVIKFEMSDAQISKIQIGDQAVLTFDALPNVEVPGEVTQIIPMDPKISLGNFSVEIGLTNPPDTIQIGMVARIKFEK